MKEAHKLELSEVYKTHMQDLRKKDLELSNQRRTLSELKSESETRERQLKEQIDSLKHEVESITVKLTENQDIIQEINVTNKKLKKKLKEKQTAAVKFEELYKSEHLLRKQLYNDMIDMKGRIRVYCRVRPLSQKEIEKGDREAIEAVDEFNVSLKNVKNLNSYDAVFGPESTQDQVFEDTKRMVQSAVDGYNVCILAYGATGSGKTHTIQGAEGNPGICPRALSELFRITSNMQQGGSYDIRIRCYMVEIY